MTRFIIIILFIALSGQLFGQAGYLKYSSLKKDHYLSFPVFKKSDDTLITQKINQHLQLSELELLQGHEVNNLFEKVGNRPGTLSGGVSVMEFKVLNNNNKLLTVKFNESSCGATCYYRVKYYNFNTGNGDRLLLPDLFTKDGYEELKKYIVKKRTSHYKKQLQKIDTAERKYFEEVVSCFPDNKLYNFYIRNKTIYIDGENCLMKNQKFSGLDMLVKFEWEDFNKYLNEYGRALFANGDSIGKFSSTALPQLFTGTINGSYPFLLLMRPEYDNQVKAIYAYERYGKGIYLEGTITGKNLTLTELTDTFEPNGTITAQYDGREITGTWTNKDQTKTLPLAATRK